VFERFDADLVKVAVSSSIESAESFGLSPDEVSDDELLF
jgi:hypothetical protein